MDEGKLEALFKRIENGDTDATAALLPLFYNELRRLAAQKLAHEYDARTLQPTVLVHEVWLRLGGDKQPSWKGRDHFFAAAAEAMRRILIDHARRKQSPRRGARAEHIHLDKSGLGIEIDQTSDDELLLLDDALNALAEIHPRRAELVKQRFFVGLTFEEAAELQGLSLRTVKRDWAYARAWLFDRMKTMREESE